MPAARVAGIPWAGKVGPGKQLPAEILQSVPADWEEMFRSMNSYESVKTNGRPGEKAWWIEQANKFYTGPALKDWLQGIEEWFSPNATPGTPGFVENAHYSTQVTRCASDTECTLRVVLQSGQFWAYNISTQVWVRANAIQPSDSLVLMQYDTAAGRWKIGQ